VMVNDQLLRESIIQSLKVEPLLVKVEEDLHSLDGILTRGRLREGLIQSLDTEPLKAEIDGMPYQGIDHGDVQRFREALLGALESGSVADAEIEVLKSLGFEKLGEFRSTVRSRLDDPAEIPEQDLAIYIPSGEEDLRGALREQFGELDLGLPAGVLGEGAEAVEISEDVSSILGEDALPRWEPSVVRKPDEREQIDIQREAEITPEPERGRVEEIQVEKLTIVRPTAAEIAEGIDFDFLKLNPVPRLTAALEAAGFDEDNFGFILRYGRYAAEGRRSDFVVGGLGLAELAKRITKWLKAQGPMDHQVQVIDEGSGELKIYLLAPEES
jgi:hypothetical protein